MHKYFAKFVSQIKVFPTNNRDISGLQRLYIYYKDKVEKLLKDFPVRKPVAKSSVLCSIIGVSKASQHQRVRLQ